MPKKYYPKLKYFQERKCVICDNEYMSNRLSQKYCSKECCTEAGKLSAFKKKKLTDFVIFERDNFKCIYCGKSSIEDGIKLVLEHIYPVRKGGDAELTNVVTACENCNGKKATNVMKEENILRLWEEIDRRNKVSGIEHHKRLKEKLQKDLQDKILKYKNGS